MDVKIRFENSTKPCVNTGGHVVLLAYSVILVLLYF